MTRVNLLSPDNLKDTLSSPLPHYFYVPYFVPFVLFTVSLYVRPGLCYDCGTGFLALGNMLAGGPFNTIAAPDPGNIAIDASRFLTWLSPGQYLVPGSFIWLGTDYGLALSVTTLIVTLLGLWGWTQVARSFAVSSSVLFVFIFGLATFVFTTRPFRVYVGGEELLFAAAPWSFYVMRGASDKRAIICFAVSLMSAALLSVAKLTGLIVFATNVVAISLLTFVNQRRLNFSIIAMWVASAIGAICFIMFWAARGSTPANGTTFAFNWFPIWFAVASVASSGVTGFEFFRSLLRHPVAIVSDNQSLLQLFSYVFGPFGLLLMAWAWLRLHQTRFREMAILFLSVIFLYIIAVATMYLWGAKISFDERHFRYAGILFFLLLLTAIDQSRVPLARSFAGVMVFLLGFYGLVETAVGTYNFVQSGKYDSASGISLDVLSPNVLDYLRSEVRQNNLQRPIAAVPRPTDVVALPGFRILLIREGPVDKNVYAQKLAGRGEKIFVITQEEMLGNGMAEDILRSFIDYKFENWRKVTIDGLVVFSQ